MKVEKTLIILRHAKAEPAQGTQSDKERPLAPRGIKEAGIIGNYMKDEALSPDVLLCSTAVRTRQTYLALRETHDSLPSADYQDALYMASKQQMAQLLAQLPKGAASAMVIGHNPELHELCVHLAAKGGAQLDRLVHGFPTCALAVIALPIDDWKNIGTAHGTLMSFVTPADIK